MKGWLLGCVAQKHTHMDVKPLLGLCWQHLASTEERGDALEKGWLLRMEP